MADPRECRAKEIQDAIGEVLYRDWDPINVSEHGLVNEYNAYIGQIYRLLASKPTWEMIADELIKIERESMGFKGVRNESLQKVAEKLLSININLSQ